MQAILAELKKNPRVPLLAAPTDSANKPALQAYVKTLERDPVGQCRGIVSACRASGQRPRCLQAVIQEGNENGYWRGKLPDGKSTLPTLQLLRDCTTRWSSTFNMVDRVLMLNPVCTCVTAGAHTTKLSVEGNPILLIGDAEC